MLGRIILTVLLILVGGGPKALGVIPLVYAVYLVFLWMVQCHLLFPIAALQPPEGNPPSDAKVSWVDNMEAKSASEAWYFENKQNLKAPTVVITHGNGEYINSYPAIARWFVQLNYNVLVPEYRGYGKSTGTPTEAGIVADIKAHLEELKFEPTFDETQLLFFGVSVGGGIGTSVAARMKHPPLAVMVQSTFFSIPKMAVDYGVPEFLSHTLLCNIYDNGANLKRLVQKNDVKVFLAHGTEDSIVPFSQAELLAAELSLSIYTRQCDHNDFHFDAGYQKELVEFLKPFTPPVLRAASP